MWQLLMIACIIGVENTQGKTYTLCHDGWLPNKGSCFWFGHVQNPMTFTKAEEYCRHNNSHLVHVSDSDENDFLKDRMRQLRPSLFWMGLTDEVTEGNWLWSGTNTTSTFLDFKPSEQAHIRENCAIFAINYDFTWADYPCSYTSVPVCEMPGWGDPQVAVVG